MLLRLKGERREEEVLAVDEGDPDLDDPADRIQAESVFPEEVAAEVAGDPTEGQDEEEVHAWPLRGLAIAGATFVPTFLAIVFGLPYLFAPGDPPRAAAVIQPPRVAERKTEAPVVGPIPIKPIESVRAPAPSSETTRQQDEARAALESRLPAPSPALRPIQPPVSEAPAAPVAAEPPRPPVAAEQPSLPPRAEPKPRIASSEPQAPKAPTSAKESRAAAVKESAASAKEAPTVREAVAKDTTGWTPAAAFADRAAAQRLASGIEQQGYPVEIRQDGSSTRPWVVWIGGQPRNGSSSSVQRRR